MTRLTVGDAMSRDVVTVSSGVTIGAAIDRGLGREHTHLVVVDDDGVLLDIVSTYLLTVAVATRLVDRDQPLAGVLAAPETAEPGTPLASAAALMLAQSADVLGVVDLSGAVLGILTWSDIGRAAVTADDARAERRPSV